MACEVTHWKRYDVPRINWGKVLIGVAGCWFHVYPAGADDLPFAGVSKGLMPVLQNSADPDMLHAIWLTVLIALIAVHVVNLVSLHSAGVGW